MPQGSFGRIVAFNDFLGGYEDITWAASSVDLGGGLYIISHEEGTIQKVVDEPGGVIQLLTDTGDDDNVALISSPLQPADGGVALEARIKVADDMSNTALFVGFSEPMLAAAPVMPAEFATTTMTYNGSGGIAGFSYDSDATTNDFRFCAGDGGAATAGAGNGTAASQTITADEWYLIRVEIDVNGTARGWISHDTNEEFKLVATFKEAVTPGDNFYPVVMCENRTGAALEFEIDYVFAEGWRDWSVG